MQIPHLFYYRNKSYKTNEVYVALKLASLHFYNKKRQDKICHYMTTKIANSTNEENRYSVKIFPFIQVTIK